MCISWSSVCVTISSTPGCGEGAPKIIYASRTHSQLSQVIRELKNTSYRFASYLGGGGGGGREGVGGWMGGLCATQCAHGVLT